MRKLFLTIGLFITFPSMIFAGPGCHEEKEKIYFETNKNDIVYIEYTLMPDCIYNNKNFPNYLYYKYPNYIINNADFYPINLNKKISNSSELKIGNVGFIDKLIFSTNRLLNKIFWLTGELTRSFDSLLFVFGMIFYYILPFFLFIYIITQFIKGLFKIDNFWDKINNRVIIGVFITFIILMSLFDFWIY